MTEAQAVDRVDRIGQTRDVIIRRYTIRKSIESVSKEDYWENKLHYHQRNLYDETDSGHQYVKWVQDHKLKLIQQSLSESETSQSAVDEKRWKVRYSEREEFEWHYFSVPLANNMDRCFSSPSVGMA